MQHQSNGTGKIVVSHTYSPKGRNMPEVPKRAQQRHNQFVALMSRAFGPLFDGHLVEGRREQEQTRLMSYFALYYSRRGERDIVFLQLEAKGPTKHTAARKVQSLSLKRGEARGRFSQLVDAPSPEELVAAENQLDELALQQALAFLGGRDLPIAAICFHEATRDGSQKVIFENGST